MLQCANVENIRCKSLDGYAGFCPMRISDGYSQTSNLEGFLMVHPIQAKIRALYYERFALGIKAPFLLLKTSFFSANMYLKVCSLDICKYFSC